MNINEPNATGSASAMGATAGELEDLEGDPLAHQDTLRASIGDVEDFDDDDFDDEFDDDFEEAWEDDLDDEGDFADLDDEGDEDVDYSGEEE